MNEVTRRGINPLLTSIIDLSFDNLDHPLTYNILPQFI
jgi:hypothetical protein